MQTRILIFKELIKIKFRKFIHRHKFTKFEILWLYFYRSVAICNLLKKESITPWLSIIQFI